MWGALKLVCICNGGLWAPSCQVSGEAFRCAPILLCLSSFLLFESSLSEPLWSDMLLPLCQLFRSALSSHSHILVRKVPQQGRPKGEMPELPVSSAGPSAAVGMLVQNVHGNSCARVFPIGTATLPCRSLLPGGGVTWNDKQGKI